MEIQKYEVLLNAVEYGSFSKTAQAMDYTQSAITHIIRGIEKEWGVKLFARSYSGVTLTPEGKHLLPLIQEAYEAELRIQEEIQVLRGLKGGMVRIGTFASVSMHYLPGVIQDFIAQYPNVGFQIFRDHYTVIEQWLLDGVVDIAFVPEPLDEQLERFPILRDKYQVVLPKEHPLTAKETIALDDLKQEPFIMLDEGDKNEFVRLMQELKLDLNVKYWVKDDASIVYMVRQGLGISILHELFLRGYSEGIEIRDLAMPVYRETMVAYLPRAKRSAATKAFLRHLGVIP